MSVERKQQTLLFQKSAGRLVMEGTNWKRVFLGGVVSGIVLNVFHLTILVISSGTVDIGTSTIVFYFVTGILAIWLYSAIRPRYGTGTQTAVIAGLFIGVLCGLTYFVSAVSASLLALYAAVAMYILATLAGSWIYKT
jgi:hypothetical protein